MTAADLRTSVARYFDEEYWIDHFRKLSRKGSLSPKKIAFVQRQYTCVVHLINEIKLWYELPHSW